MQTRYDTENKEKEAEIYRLKNVELVEANRKINQKNVELNSHKEHLRLINRILRHDLVNNFAAIKSAIRIYNDTREDDLLIHIDQSVMKGIQLIHRMRKLEDIVRLNDNLKVMELSSIIDPFIDMYKSKVNITRAGFGKVLVDEAINSVIDNIISNAVIHGKAENINISIEAKAENVQIRITDDGCGIPDKIKEQVFEECYSYGISGNTGLGLYIVKKTIENYGGEISIMDNKPKGAVFSIKLRKVE